MWISRKEYDRLIERAKRSEEKVRYYSDKFDSVRMYNDRVLVDSECIMMNKDCFYKILKKEMLKSDEIKDIKAELEWYKTKYFELKNNTTNKKGKWINLNNGDATCDQCRFTQKYIYDDDKYQRYCGVCGAEMSLDSEEV